MNRYLLNIPVSHVDLERGYIRMDRVEIKILNNAYYNIITKLLSDRLICYPKFSDSRFI